MNEKKYLVYVDIQGFEDLLKDIGNERGIESRKVRNNFISVIENALSGGELGWRDTFEEEYGEYFEDDNKDEKKKKGDKYAKTKFYL